MICPHCHRTIAEQDRYLMSVDPGAELPAWAKTAVWLIVLFLLAVLVWWLATHAVAG